MEPFKDTDLIKLELLSNAMTIDRTLKYIKSKQYQQVQEEPWKIAVTTTKNQGFWDLWIVRCIAICYV